ncbi:signal recognition particle-docking protein FtsY [Secundilactobacillus hailunensis]|uniref:Signal recognition particle receptor FtsY n=1 Tax=Secundilactobacillus hailunensis TaxID=2559923 RepID=A0ABW1TCU3_9LACO|nr:signal recognition particle-docking protein FtsY [Secundilactobacillus hailunensis]
MGLFDFFKRRAKQDKSKKTDEQAPKVETPKTDNSTETAETVKETPKTDESAAKTVTISDVPAAEKPAQIAETPTNENQSDEAESPVEPQTVKATEATPEKPAESATPADQDEQQTETVETPETSTDQEPESQKSESQEPESQQAESAEPEKKQAETDVEQPTLAADNTGTNNAESSDDEQPATTDAERYDKGLEKSRLTFGQRLNHLLANFRSVDENFFDDLEETLIGADVGYDMAMKISDELREEVKLKNVKKSKDVQNVVVKKLIELYDQAGTNENNGLNFAKEGPTVILFVGVNGVGKTTTIGKMANLFKQQGKKVLLAAADTFRAGAIEQLNVWAQRDGVDIVKKPEQSDPSAVVYDALKKAKSENYDILFVDTAGRLQNKTNLMNELEKMKRVITREIPDAPHEVLLVLDATTGQNALNQAKLFQEATNVSGIVLTKLDGTARGGIVLAIRNELHLPVKYVGLGEQVDDLRPFEPSEFVYGLFKGLIDVK